MAEGVGRTTAAIVAAGCATVAVALGNRAAFGLFLEQMTAFHG